MRDRDTVITHPHATVRHDGYDDPRTSIAIPDQGATLTLFFESPAWTGDTPLLEIRLTPPATGAFEPWRLVPNLPLYTQYARAGLARDAGDTVAALRALRQVSSARRGLSDDFLRIVAELYGGLVKEREPYPIKALAQTQPVDISTASRWVSAARARGFIEEDTR